MITRIVPPPFSLEPEAVESLGTISKVFEVGTLVALALFFGPRIIPARLSIAVANDTSFTFLFLGVITSLIVNNFEVYSYWWVLSGKAFLVTSFLLIGLVVYGSLAHYLRKGLLVGLTWSFAVMVIILHGIYALDYANAGLAFPLLLCVLSGTLLAASMVLLPKGRAFFSGIPGYEAGATSLSEM